MTIVVSCQLFVVCRLTTNNQQLTTMKSKKYLQFSAKQCIIILVSYTWAISSAGRASALQAECQQFDPVIAHHKRKEAISIYPLVASFIFTILLIWYLTSCIRDSLSFARRFAPSNDVRCGTSSILLSPTKTKRHLAYCC